MENVQRRIILGGLVIAAILVLFPPKRETMIYYRSQDRVSKVDRGFLFGPSVVSDIKSEHGGKIGAVVRQIDIYRLIAEMTFVTICTAMSVFISAEFSSRVKDRSNTG